MNELFIMLGVLGLSLLDSYWTYRRVVLYNKINIDATKLELNGLTKLLWEKLGLKIGSMVSAIISLIIILTLCSLISLYFVYFILGVLTITNLLHFADLNMLKKTIKERESQIGNILEEEKKAKIKREGKERCQ
jgi:hypothetical protein